MKDLLLQLTNIDVEFGGRPVLCRAQLQVHAGEIVTLIGPNGAGKTTLVRVALRLLKPNAGSRWCRSGLRIGYMPQKLHIDGTLPLSVERFLRLVPNVDRAMAQQALMEVGAERVLDSPLQRISGGELQRVLLARALLRQPHLLVLDEPTQGVDVGGQVELYQLITRLRARYGCGVLMISHDLHWVMNTTDRVVCLNQHICCSGHPTQVTADPAFIQLFGQEAGGLALYPHHHEHSHDASGRSVPPCMSTQERQH